MIENTNIQGFLPIKVNKKLFTVALDNITRLRWAPSADLVDDARRFIDAHEGSEVMVYDVPSVFTRYNFVENEYWRTSDYVELLELRLLLIKESIKLRSLSVAQSVKTSKLYNECELELEPLVKTIYDPNRYTVLFIPESSDEALTCMNKMTELLLKHPEAPIYYQTLRASFYKLYKKLKKLEDKNEKI